MNIEEKFQQIIKQNQEIRWEDIFRNPPNTFAEILAGLKIIMNKLQEMYLKYQEIEQEVSQSIFRRFKTEELIDEFQKLLIKKEETIIEIQRLRNEKNTLEQQFSLRYLNLIKKYNLEDNEENKEALLGMKKKKGVEPDEELIILRRKIADTSYNLEHNEATLQEYREMERSFLGIIELISCHLRLITEK
jgi:hypothetical protein